MREKITATEGHVLTDGNTYGSEIYLADGISAEYFYEITIDEYQSLQKQHIEKDGDEL